MKRGRLIFNTMLLMVLPIFSFAETLDRNEISSVSPDMPTVSINVQEQKIRHSCYGISMLAYDIMGEKFRKVPLEKSTYYNADKNPRLNEIFGKSLPALQALTKTIYELPYVEDLQERENQLKMVENLVTASCAISLTS